MTHQELLEIGIKKRNKQIDTSWQELAEKYSNGLFPTGEAYRCWVKVRQKSEGKKTNAPTIKEAAELPNYKEEVEIHKDGSQSSNKLVRMSIEDSKDVEYLLSAHGYDKNSWELISAKNNIWNTYSQADGISTLYSSKISVKPKVVGFSFEMLIEEIRKETPIYITPIYSDVKDKRLLEIPLFDSHFGISDLEHYKQTQTDIHNVIVSSHWEEILFVIGQDLIHHDNFRSQTSSGTTIENVNMVKAWKDAKEFYYPLIALALKNSNNVKIIYSKGNHDESMSWAFVQTLMEKFPEANFDDSFVERKAHTFGEIFIGVTHGDKAKKNLHNLFPVEFPMDWAKAKTREIHTGHFHKEDATDVFGMMVRTLSTRNKTDQWHKDNGYVGAHKRFMLFEYNEKELKKIHYV